jgi:hypothetical protein
VFGLDFRFSTEEVMNRRRKGVAAPISGPVGASSPLAEIPSDYQRPQSEQKEAEKVLRRLVCLAALCIKNIYPLDDGFLFPAHIASYHSEKCPK